MFDSGVLYSEDLRMVLPLYFGLELRALLAVSEILSTIV